MTETDVRSIYVVDDEPHALELYRRCLKGYHVKTFEHPEKALEAIVSEFPTCLLVDYRMPTMTGVELVRRCRMQGYEGAALMITAFGDLDEVVFAEQMDLIYRIMPKPIRLDEVQELVDLTVAESRFRTNLEGRRKHPRLHIPVDLEIQEKDHWKKVSPRNISLGGLLVEMRTPHPLPKKIAIRLHDAERTFEAHGHVVFVKEEGIGVEFEDAGPGFREALAAIITAQRFGPKKKKT